MKGINIAELYDFLSNGHELEFWYQNNEFSLEPYGDGTDSGFGIWDVTHGGKLIAKVINNGGDDTAAIDSLLQIPCFDGKSFMEVEKDIIVETIW